MLSKTNLKKGDTKMDILSDLFHNFNFHEIVIVINSILRTETTFIEKVGCKKKKKQPLLCFLVSN